MNAIYGFCPYPVIAPFSTTVFNLLLHKLQEATKVNKTHQYAKHFLHNICIFSGMYGGDKLFQLMESITPGLVGMILMNIWPHNRASLVTRNDDKKHVLIGGSKLLTESPIVDNFDVWVSLVKSLIAVFSTHKDLPKLEMPLDEDNLDGKEFDSTYSKLSYSGILYVDAVCANEMSGQEYFCKSLATFTHNKPGTYGALIQSSLDENEKNALHSMLHQYNVSIA